MKHLLAALTVSALIAASAPAAAKSPLSHKQTAAVAAYFSDRLADRPAEFTSRLPLGKGRESELRDTLWSLWAQANEAFPEPRLPEPADMYAPGFDPRNPAATGVWPIVGGDMQYIWAHKGEVAPGSRYPLFIYLHGSGPNDHEWMAGTSWCRRFDDSPSLYFIPRSPEGGTGCRWYQPSRQKAWERVIRQSYLRGDVDPDRIYIFGISEGGYGSQRLASFYADYLAGAGPIAGGEPSYNCPPANTANIAFCQQTGADDTMYGRSRVVAADSAEWHRLAEAHPGYYHHRINLQPGRGHGCDYTVTTPWLARFSRNPRPRYVYWENYPMGNVNGEGLRGRRSFYNVRVLEGAADTADVMERDVYEITFGPDNRIDVKASVVRVEPDGEVSEDGWTMKLAATRTFTPARTGRLRLYLDSGLVDMSRPVIVIVNGRERFSGMVKTDGRWMVESLAEFFDPERIFPAAVDVDVAP